MHLKEKKTSKGNHLITERCLLQINCQLTIKSSLKRENTSFVDQISFLKRAFRLESVLHVDMAIER